jgi:integrase
MEVVYFSMEETLICPVGNGITFHDIRRTVKTNMLNAGVDKVYRDTILGHSLQGMDVHYMSPSEDDLHRAMEIYAAWLDAQIQSVAHIVAQAN